MTPEGLYMLVILGIGFFLGIFFSITLFLYYFSGKPGSKARKWLAEL